MPARSKFLHSLATVFLVLCSVANVRAQEINCYGPGSIAGAVIGTLVCTLLILALFFYGYKCFLKTRREKHLVLETDPENGDKYAFDNPCFKDASGGGGGLTPIGKALDKSGTRLLDTGKKWSQWTPLGAFVSTKNEKKRSLDDSHIEDGEVKMVSLRSHDFTGLGFNICGNMSNGIFIKDVLHRGPASESGKLKPGDRINSVRICFEHMLYEDALTILCYASPYEVEIEAKSSPKGHHGLPNSGGGAQPRHPIFKCSSSSDLVKIGKSARQRLFQRGTPMDTSLTTDYSTLQLSSNNTSLERGRKSSRSDVNTLTKPERTKKIQNTGKNLSPEQLKSQLEQNLAKKISNPPDIHASDIKHQKENKTEAEKQTSEADNANKNRFQKFGVRVLPMESKTDNVQPSRSPKSAELSQNDNNINQERQLENATITTTTNSTILQEGIDEVDKTKVLNGKIDEAPPVKRREKAKNGDIPKEILPENIKETINFERQNSLNGSGIRRDKAGIPQEIPDHMLQAAVVARKNRKSSEVLDKIIHEPEEESIKTPKKQKGKAPAPPPDVTKVDTKETETNSDLTEIILKTSNVSTRLNFTDNFDEISTLEEEKESKPIKKLPSLDQTEEATTDIKPEPIATDDGKEYCSDSDLETDNQSSVNTIELNSSDITIHHADQNSEMKGRKTASTGDLSKIQKEKKPNTGTLERAQSLDITDSGIPTLTKKRKATKDDLDSKLSSDESLYEKPSLKVKEPRLSLALDGLDTFQRNRLKKSSEWGNLEDAVMNNDDVTSSIEEKIDFVESKSPIKFDFGCKDPTFGNSVTHLSDVHVTLVENDVVNEEEIGEVKNILWPSKKDSNTSESTEIELNIQTTKPQIVDKKDKITTESNNINIHNVLWPVSDSDKTKINTEHSINIQTISDIPITPESENISTTFHSKTEISSEPLEKPPTSQKPQISEAPFSLKAQFQEKLNSRLNQNSESVTPVTTTTKIENNNVSSTTLTVKPPQPENSIFHLGKSSQNFIFAEKYASNNDSDNYGVPSKLYDTNVSDDIKVSRHSLGSLERPKSDVLKSVNKLKMQSLISSDQGGVSNVTVTESTAYENGIQITKNSTEDNQNEPDVSNNIYDMSTASELYTTAIDSTLCDDKPEADQNYASGIQNITITETLSDCKYLADSPSSLTIDTSSDGPESIKSNTLTFVTEIQVSTPSSPNCTNVSDIEITTDSKENDEQKPEETLKKLPEMKFSTSSYESPRTPEKRMSQIELLRSNFEKSPPKSSKPEISPSKSRIPVATKIEFKSDRREMDTEEKEIVEIMSAAVHSTPLVPNQRFPMKNPPRNVTVTSIRTSSKIPSGQHLATTTFPNKPPVPARPTEHSETLDARTVSANGNSESSFKQWVFNPSESAVTNIVVNNNKEAHK